MLQLQLRRVKPNKSVEAYTGKHVGRRRDRTLRSLIQPRHDNMQMATSSAERKPIQTDRIGEVREDLPGSTLERGMRVEKRQELGRPFEFPF